MVGHDNVDAEQRCPEAQILGVRKGRSKESRARLKTERTDTCIHKDRKVETNGTNCQDTSVVGSVRPAINDKR